MRKFGVVNEERTSLSNSTLKAPVAEELPTELDENLEVTELDEEAQALQDMLDNMNSSRQTPRDHWLEEIELENLTSEEAAKILDQVITNVCTRKPIRWGVW